MVYVATVLFVYSFPHQPVVHALLVYLPSSVPLGRVYSVPAEVLTAAVHGLCSWTVSDIEDAFGSGQFGQCVAELQLGLEDAVEGLGLALVTYGLFLQCGLPFGEAVFHRSFSFAFLSSLCVSS